MPAIPTRGGGLVEWSDKPVEQESEKHLYQAITRNGTEKTHVGYAVAKNLEEATEAFRRAQLSGRKKFKAGSALAILNDATLTGELEVREISEVGSYKIKLEKKVDQRADPWNTARDPTYG